MKRAILCIALLFSTACSHKPVTVAVPPAPPPQEENAPTGTPPVQAGQSRTPSKPEITDISPDAKALSTETGIASWYGAPYHNRRASNGEVYDMHAMTAAHRTLPLGTMVRVTNLENHRSVVVRINDRGPFARKRIIDLSPAAARAIGVRNQGLMHVKIEALGQEAAIQ